MQRYDYEGPVMAFHQCLNPKWKASTVAVTETKAKANLAYQYKRRMGLSPQSKITLSGKVLPVAE